MYDCIYRDDAKAIAYMERTYVPYKITVDIPDIKCEKVSLRKPQGVMMIHLDAWIIVMSCPPH